MARRIELGAVYYADPTKGRPISDGFIYVGEPYLDPEVVANQIQVFALQENGDTIEIAQPIALSAGGLPIYNGSPVTITVKEAYSLKVVDSLGAQKLYYPKDTANTIEEEGDIQVDRVIAEGDFQTERVSDEGDLQYNRVLDEGDLQTLRVENEGDTQYNRVIAAGTVVNKAVRQTMLSGPDLEATPSTVETAGTKTGDLRSTYHDIGMDMLTGSRGGMSITKPKGAGSNVLQASILSEIRSYLNTDDTGVEATDTDSLQQLLANGLQFGASADLTSANLCAFQTTHKTVLDGNEWHYNPVSGFAMCKYVGTGANRELRHPMGKEPLFFSIKDIEGVVNWLTGRKGSNGYMILNDTTAEAEASITWNDKEPTDTYISLGTSTNVNWSGHKHFLFGWFGDPLDDLEVGMSGERGVTASWISASGGTVDTAITDIQTVIYKKINDTGDWNILNKASGFGNFTILNDTDAESTQTLVTVSGSEVTFGAHSDEYLVVVVGGTADAPDNKLKQGTEVLRKVGTAASGHRVDLGAAFSGGTNGGMMFGRAVGLVKSNLLSDTVRGAEHYMFTDLTNADAQAASVVSAFTSTGVTLGIADVLNSASLTQYTAFNTTHKITTGDGLDWEYNPLTGFAMCKYTGDGIAGRTLTHPMQKKLRMGWFKNLDSVFDWPVYMDSLADPGLGALILSTTDAISTSILYFNDTEATDSVITLGDGNAINNGVDEYIFYGWFGDDLDVDPDVPVSGELGVSAMFQYVGGSGAMSVDTGIENITAVLLKTSSAVGDWHYYTNTNSVNSNRYFLNTTATETVNAFIQVDGTIVSFPGQVGTAEFIVFGSKADSGVDNDVILPSTVGDPTIASMANGFDASLGGQVDIITELIAPQTLNVTGEAGKKFIVLKEDGLLYFTSTRPTYERDLVPYADGKYTYGIDQAKMYNNGVVDSSVVIGECILDNEGNVYDIKTHAKGDVWETNWFTSIASSVFYEVNVFGHLELAQGLYGKLASGEIMNLLDLVETSEDIIAIITETTPDAPNYKLKVRRTF